MDPAVEFAKDYIEDLLTFFGLNTSVEVKEEADSSTLNIPSSHLNGFLIGNRGENLRAIQYLLNMALRAAGHEEATIGVDVAGYKAQRAERLSRHVKKIAQEVATSGQSQPLEAMNAYDRRVAHQTVTEVEGVTSASEGTGRDRHVVITPEGQPSAATEEE